MKKVQENLFSISDLANEFRIGKDTIAFYGSHKLLRSNPQKAEDAFYHPLDKVRLAFILRAKNADYSIGAIKALIGEIDLKKGPDAQIEESLGFSKKKHDQLKSSLGDLDILDQINVSCDIELLEKYINELSKLKYGLHEKPFSSPSKPAFKTTPAERGAKTAARGKAAGKSVDKTAFMKTPNLKSGTKLPLKLSLATLAFLLLTITGYLVLDYTDRQSGMAKDTVHEAAEPSTADSAVPAETNFPKTIAGQSNQNETASDRKPDPLKEPSGLLDFPALTQTPQIPDELSEQKDDVSELSQALIRAEELKTQKPGSAEETSDEEFFQQLVADLQKKYDEQEKKQAPQRVDTQKENFATPKKTDSARSNNSAVAAATGVSALTQKNTVDGIKKDSEKPISREKIETKAPQAPAEEKAILKPEPSTKAATKSPLMWPKDTQKQPVPVPTQIEKPSVNAADKAPPQPILKATPPTAPVVQPGPLPSTDNDATEAVTTPSPAKRDKAMDTASPAPKPEPKPAPAKPVNPEALQWAQKSYESVLKGDAGEAIVAATVALTLEPELVNAYINRSWAYSQKGRYEKAIADCNKALEIDPDNALAYNNRGLALQEKGDINSAKADYDKACRLGFDAACRNFQEVAGR